MDANYLRLQARIDAMQCVVAKLFEALLFSDPQRACAMLDFLDRYALEVHSEPDASSVLEAEELRAFIGTLCQMRAKRESAAVMRETLARLKSGARPDRE